MIFKFEHNQITVKMLFNNPNDFLAKQIIEHERFYEYRYLKYLEKHKKQLFKKNNPTIIDVGANIGNHTIFFAKILKGRVFSFEPLGDVYKVLCKNIKLNHITPQVISRKLAISSIKRDVKIIKSYKDKCGSTQWWYTPKRSKETTGFVSSLPLDMIFRRKIDLIKIDVEGMEMEVLKGARRIIEKDSPLIMIEITKIKDVIKHQEEFMKWMYKNNYTFIGTDQYNRTTHLIAKNGTVNIEE